MENLKSKRLLILGGSRISCEIIEKAREKGIVTGVTDWYPLEKSPAKQMADEAYFVSTADTEAIKELFISKNFDGIITGFTDSVLPYYAKVCSELGIPCYGTEEQFKILTDKNKYKKLLQKYNIPTTRDISLKQLCEDNVNYPVIIKPSDGSGSKGISICKDREEVEKAIQFAKKNSSSEDILIEEYLEGEEVTIFWLFIDGTPYLALIGNRLVKKIEDSLIPLPVGYTYPSNVTPYVQQELEDKFKQMFEEMGLQNGWMFMQCKLKDGVPYVYDIGYRLTGSLEYYNLEDCCGFNPLEMLIHFALTGDMVPPALDLRVDPYLNSKISYNVSLLSKVGKIKDITGIEEIKTIPGVAKVYIAHPKGDEITEAMLGRLSQITVRVLGNVESIEELGSVMNQIHDGVSIISQSDENLLLPGISLEDDLRVIE